MEEDKKEDSKIKKLVKEYLPFLIALIAILLFKRYLYSPIKVNGASMDDTLKDGDIMILDIIGKKTSSLKRFDIVVVNIENELIIKRVIGLPGEKVVYKDNVLYINEQKVEDNYASTPTGDFSVEVPYGEYFVMGDNREVSKDSRYFGCFPESSILGRTSLVIYPFDRFGEKK